MAKIEDYPETLNKQRLYKPQKSLQGKDKYEKVREIALETVKEGTPLLLDLLKHYDIDPNMGEKTWFSLSLALARDHVPAFQQKDKPGKKEEWTLKEKMKLVVAFELEIHGGNSTSTAAKNISKSGYFDRIYKETGRRLNRSGKTLNNVHKEILALKTDDDKFIRVLCEIIKKHSSTPEDYIASLIETINTL